MSSIMRWRNGLMGLSVIAKAPVSHGVEPHDLETGQTFAFLFSPWRAPPAARHPYRASGLVLAQIADILQGCGEHVMSTQSDLQDRSHERARSAVKRTSS